MKKSLTENLAKIGLILGGSCFLFISSCAMSESRSRKYGAGVGTVGGAAVGAALAKKHGRGTGDVIKGGIFGGAIGHSIGSAIGERSSTLDGLGGVE